MEPPITYRPVGHPIVTALESDDVAGAFLSRMVEFLGPEDWAVTTPNGFWWIPWRLRHEIEIIELSTTGTDPVLICRSTFTLVEQVEDLAQALAICNYLNSRPLGAVAWFDAESAQIRFTSSVQLSAARWFDAIVFVSVVQRLVGLAEALAPRLAGWAGGARAPSTAHPTLGYRTSPDRFLDETSLSFYVPEAGTGIWWSRSELTEFRHALRCILTDNGQRRAAAAIDVSSFDTSATTVDNLRQHIDIDRRDGPARLWIKPSEHHEIGCGVEVLLQTRVTFAGERDPSARPDSSVYALSAADALNAVSIEHGRHPLSIGAWSVWRGQLSYSMFLPPEVIRIVQSHAEGCAGTVMAVMAMDVVSRSSDLPTADQLAQERYQQVFGPSEIADEYLWDGVEMNAGVFSMYVDGDAVFAKVTEGVPVNELLDPIELDDDAWMMQHNEVIARMGIFNPMGPSVGTIEIAINYATQQALLLERTRHPSSPSLHLWAVLDRDGFDRRAVFVEQMLPRLRWGTFDWFDVRTDDETITAAIRRGLIGFAASRQIDVNHEAMLILENLDDPWSRVSTRTTRHTLSPDADVEAFWIPAITDPRNLNAHYAMLRSAWEGALVYATTADAAKAQGVADACVAEISRRGGTYTSST